MANDGLLKIPAPGYPSYVKISMMEKRIVFMGSPDFAVPILQGLAENYNVVGVVSQPDRPSGRGQVMTPPPVKKLAVELGIPVMQPMKLRLPESFDQLAGWKPDVIVVAAYGQILRQNVLDLPPLGCINVHASYLPRWRGAAPIQAVINAGDETTGVSIMRMDAGVDTGPVYHQAVEKILPDDTAGRLSDRLAVLGKETLLAVLPEIISGKLKPIRQQEELATYASMLKKEDGQLDWNLSATALERKVRALNDWPGTFTSWKGQLLKVRSAKVIAKTGMEPGTRMILDGLPAAMTTDGALALLEVQPAGKKWMSGRDFLNGNPDWTRPGERTGD
jgi:methionyl-tRNA formyltransferase